jgi:polyisoprenoid-binding protein YceI
MKKIILGLVLLVSTIASSQKLITRSGEIKFEASMPAFEEVAAKNNSASCILDTSNGDFVALALVKAFKFKVPLMEEHFNENYIESSQFPKSTFKGKILGFDKSKLTSTKMSYDLEGDLTLHGVTKKIKVKAFLVMNAGKVSVFSNFSVKPLDYGIKIPNLVKSKVAEEVKIAFNFTLEG